MLPAGGVPTSTSNTHQHRARSASGTSAPAPPVPVPGERWRGGRRFDARSESSGRVRVAPVRMGPPSVRTRARRERPSASRLRAPRWAPTEHPVAVFSRRQPTATGGLPRARCGVRASDSVPSRPTPHAYQSPSVAYQGFTFDMSIFAALVTGCPPGGRTRAATRCKGPFART